MQSISIKLSLLSTLLFLTIFGIESKAECKIAYDVMYQIATNEKHTKRDIGYPFLISFNNSGDVKKLNTHEKGLMIDSRTMDCKNENLCIHLFKRLTKRGITNIDLGAFQLNYVYHKFEPNEYFRLNKSYHRACAYLTYLKKEYGWSWKTIGRYHSGTPKYNKRYYSNIKRRIEADEKS